MEQLKKFSPGFYVIIILLFFLPFVNLSCSGQTIISLTGFQLITGAQYSEQDMFGQRNTTEIKEKNEIAAQPFALFALLTAIAGLALSFIRKKPIALINIVISLLGAVFLIALRVNIDSDSKISGQEIIKLEYQTGYWLTFLFFLITAVAYWIIFKEKEPVVANVSEVPPPQQPQQ